MLESVLAIPFWIEFAGTLTGGLAGGAAAARARYDMFGTVVIAIVTGLGGGIMRDVLLQDFGIYSFQHPVLILTCVGAGVVVFYFHKVADAFDWVMDFLDNLAVGLWAVVSVGKALSAGQGIVPSIILGTVTAVGGGIMRDVLMARTPLAFQAGTLYGTAALFGSTVFALMKQNDVMGDYAAITCVGIVLALRYASEFFGWSTRPSKDYSDRVIEPVKKVAHVAARPVKRAVIEPVKEAVERHTPQRRTPKERVAALYRERSKAEAQARENARKRQADIAAEATRTIAKRTGDAIAQDVRSEDSRAKDEAIAALHASDKTIALAPITAEQAEGAAHGKHAAGAMAKDDARTTTSTRTEDISDEPTEPFAQLVTVTDDAAVTRRDPSQAREAARTAQMAAVQKRDGHRAAEDESASEDKKGEGAESAEKTDDTEPAK